MTAIATLARTAAVVALAGVAISACAAGDGDAAPTTAASATPPATSPSPDASSEAPARTVELPASGELDGRRVTVEEVGAAELFLTELEPGNEAIYLKVTVENVAAEPWRSTMLQFFLVDAAGEEYAPELLGSDAGDNLPDVDPLEVGQASEGYIAYQVPEGAELTLSYAVNLGAGLTIEIPVR